MPRTSRWATAILCLALTATGLLAGCGGSSNNGGGSNPTTQVNGSVNLPSASGLTLTIASAGADSPLTSNQFKLTLPGADYNVVSATDNASGKTVLIGMREPDSTSLTLDATNCARTLVFLSLGGSQSNAENRKTLWDKIKASTQVATLATTITTELATDVFALENGNANIKAALDAAITANQSSSLLNNQTQISEGRATRADDPPIRFSVDQPGVKARYGEVAAENSGFAIDNRFSSLEGSFFTYNVGFSDGEEWHDTLPEAVFGEKKFSPETKTDTSALAIQDPHKGEKIDVVVLQPVFDAAEPAVFGNADYANQLASWRASLTPMYRRGYMAVAGASLLDAFGAPAVDFTPERLDQTVTAVSEINAETGTIITTSGQGQNLSGLVADLAGVAGGSDADAFSILAAIAPLLQNSYPELAEKLATKSLTSAQIQGFRGTLRILSKLGSWTYSAKAGEIATALTTGTPASQAKGMLTQAFITLDPQVTQFEAGQSLLITANPDKSITTVPNTTVEYEWKIEPGFGAITDAVLNDNKGKVGTTITTDSTKVYLVTGADSVGIALVKVTAVVTDSNNEKRYYSVDGRYTPQGHFELSPIFIRPGIDGPDWYFIAAATWIMKPAAVNGTYAAAKFHITAEVSDHPWANNNGHIEREWNIPAYTGAIIPTTRDPRYLFSTASHLHPAWSTGDSDMGISVFDYGDRLLIYNFSGGGDNADGEYLTWITQEMWKWANAVSARYTLK